MVTLSQRQIALVAAVLFAIAGGIFLVVVTMTLGDRPKPNFVWLVGLTVPVIVFAATGFRIGGRSLPRSDTPLIVRTIGRGLLGTFIAFALSTLVLSVAFTLLNWNESFYDIFFAYFIFGLLWYWWLIIALGALTGSGLFLLHRAA